MKIKKIIAILLVMLLALSCVACADGGAKKRTASNGKKENTLTLSINDQVTTFDPLLFKLSVEDAVNSSIYEPLFYMDNDGNFIWCVAESMDRNDDGSVTFHLRKDLKFHSGDTMKAEDVIYTYQRTAYSTAMSALSQATVLSEIDETTVKMEFPMGDQGYNFDALYPYMLMTKIMNKSYCEEHIASMEEDMKFNVDGTGPYKLESKADNGDVTIVAFEDYYQEVPIKTIKYKFVSGDFEAAFEAGDIDLCTYSGSNYENIKTYENVTAFSQSVNNVTFLINNSTADSPLNDPVVREAVTYALNRKDVCAIGSNDAGTVAWNLANPIIKHYTEGTVIEQNADKAKELMASAGYSESNPCNVTMIVLGSNTAWVAACEVMKEMLDPCYFNVTIEQVADSARYFTYDFDMGLISIALTTDFMSYGDLFRMETGLNLAGIEDADVLAAFDKMADGTAESAQAAMKAATAANCYVPLWYNTFFFAHDKDLIAGPFYTEMSGFLYRDFAWAE